VITSYAKMIDEEVESRMERRIERKIVALKKIMYDSVPVFNMSQINAHTYLRNRAEQRKLDPMFHPEHGTILFGDPTDLILSGTPTTDNDKLYLQMAEWLSVYPDREGDDVLFTEFGYSVHKVETDSTELSHLPLG
jgi:hypothetical protein